MLIIYFCMPWALLKFLSPPPPPQADSPVSPPDSENGKFSVRYSVTYYVNTFTHIILIIRGVMPIQRFLSQVDFKWSFQKTKNSRFIFSIFNTITQVYSTAHYNQSHTILLSLWIQWPIRGVQMSHRLNASVFFTRSLTECLFLANSLVRNNKVQMCVRICKILIS